MRKSFGSQPWTYPQVVFIIGSYDENGKADAMNAAWCGMGNDDEIVMCISAGHKTTKNILANKDFTVSFATKDQLVPSDFVGVVSGNDDPDKIAKTGWTVVKAENVNAPYFEELPMTLECRLREYDEKNCYMYGKIVNVSIDESVLTDGKPDPDKMGLIAFDQVHGKYRILGEVVGNAFEAGFELNK